MIAVAGSTWVIGATSTRPPPKRRRRLPVRELPVRALPVRADSAAVRTDGAVATRGAGRRRWRRQPVPTLAFSGAIPQVSQ